MSKSRLGNDSDGARQPLLPRSNRTNSKKVALTALLAVGLAASSLAQVNPFAAAIANPWDSLLKPSKAKIQPTMVNATVDRVFTYFQNISGITIVRDPLLTGNLTISSAKPVTVSEAFGILSA